MLSILTYRLLVVAWITAQRQLIHEKTTSRDTWNQSYDFIVVGAGSAGSVVANRLTEDRGVNVLLLEAGGPQSAVYNDIPGMWTYIGSTGINEWFYDYNVRQPYKAGHPLIQTGKTLGGTSAHNSMTYNRGNRRGFDEWVTTYGAKGWGYEEILPYFKKFENNTDVELVRQNPGFHGTRGPVQITSPSKTPKVFKLLNKAFNELGFKETDINGANQTGYMNAQTYITTDGLRAGNGNAYIDPNPHPKNLHIVTKALVVKILFKGLTAIGVEFIKNSKTYEVFADKEVIISCGPYNSPQLLLQSGIGPKEHLDQFEISTIVDLPVGDNLAVHPLLRLVFKVDPSLTLSYPQLSTKQLSQLYFHRNGSLSSMACNVLYFDTYGKQWPNGLILTAGYNGTLDIGVSLSRPRSRGTIRLQSTDPRIQPQIITNVLTDSQDVEDFVNIISFLYYVLEKSSIFKFVSISPLSVVGCLSCVNKFNYQCKDTIRCLVKRTTITNSHPSGSCRMGSLMRSDVVVDPYLRVINVRNLRVCDSSVFPSPPNANTNAASIMVGEKCAQIIKKCYN